MAFVDSRLLKLYAHKTKVGTALKTNDIEGTKPRKKGFDRSPDAFKNLIQPDIEKPITKVDISSPK